MTDIVILPDVTPSETAPLITLPSAAEFEFFKIPSLSRYWRASPEYSDGAAWVDDRRGGRALLLRSDWPLPRTDETGRYFIPQDVSTPTSVWGEEGDVIPIGEDFTILFVARVEEGSRESEQVIVGNGVPNLGEASFVGYTPSGASLRFRSRGTDHISYPIGSAANARHSVVLSYSHQSSESRLYVNGVLVGSGSIRTTLTSSDLSLCGLMRRSASGVTGSTFRGRIYEASVFRSALHKNPLHLSAALTYLADQYGG